jgi:RND superfamily putative drug exporter
MVLASLTLLPAFLGLAGHLDQPRSGTAGAVVRLVRAGGVGGHVSRHAAAYAVGATVLLLALAAPVLALRVGTPDDGALPVQRTERRAYDLVAAGFGAGSNGPLVIAVDVSRDPSVVQPLFNAVRADRGIASVAPPSGEHARPASRR